MVRRRTQKRTKRRGGRVRRTRRTRRSVGGLRFPSWRRKSRKSNNEARMMAGLEDAARKSNAYVLTNTPRKSWRRRKYNNFKQKFSRKKTKEEYKKKLGFWGTFIPDGTEITYSSRNNKYIATGTVKDSRVFQKDNLVKHYVIVELVGGFTQEIDFSVTIDKKTGEPVNGKIGEFVVKSAETPRGLKYEL